MFILYQILLNVTRFVLKITAIFSSRNKVKFKERTTFNKPESSLPILWFHAASYGEFEGILPIIKQAKSENKYFILCSFFSDSAYIPLKNHPLVDQAVYAPFDSAKDVSHFLDVFNPIGLLISQNEYWPQMIRTCLDRQIQVHYIGTYVRQNHWWLTGITKRLTSSLKDVSSIHLQDVQSYGLMEKAGFTNIHLSGNPRVDQVLQTKTENRVYPIIKDFATRKPLLVCGSTLPKDNTLLFDLIRQIQSVNMLIIPHEPETFDYTQLNKTNVNWIKYSDIDGQVAENIQLIVMNTIGDLKYLYRYGTIAYVGGGFDAGVHSVLEAAVFEIPILTGPNIQKFKSAVELQNLGCLIVVNNKLQMESSIDTILNGDNDSIKDKLEHYINSNAGISKRIWDSIGLSR